MNPKPSNIIWSFCLLGCSNIDTTPASEPIPGANREPLRILASDTAPSATAGAPNGSNPLSIHVQPRDGCQVTAAGATNNSTYVGFLTADRDGVARFFPPPPQWGTKLEFSCGQGGGARTTHLVDLNDESTFSKEPSSFAGPGVIGERPALTSDQVQSISPSDLRSGGYPLRPDRNQSPAMYAKWLELVTKPFNIISSAGVTDFSAIGANFNGRYGGSNVNGPVPWTGLVQDTAGFTGIPDTSDNFDGGFPLAVSGLHYTSYEVLMNNPATACPSGSLCSTMFWGGIGGYPVDFFGGPFLTPLIQSGIWSGAQGGANTLFIEYLNGDLPTPNQTCQNLQPGACNTGFPKRVFPGVGQVLANGDELFVEGWAGDESCTESSSGAWGCFLFYDFTQGWQTQIFQLVLPPGGPSPFLGATAEWVTELAYVQGLPTSNAVYLGQAMDGVGFDPSWVGHQASTGDPYIFTAQADYQPNVDSHAQVNLANFVGLPDNDPQTWVDFSWQGFQ